MMDLIIHNFDDVLIAELPRSFPTVNDTDEILDIMVNAGYQGANKLIIYEDQLPKGFFDLKTRIAGEVLQKFSNYRMKLAIIGNFSKYKSKSLKDFIFESNKTGLVIFVSSAAEAKRFFSSQKPV